MKQNGTHTRARNTSKPRETVQRYELSRCKVPACPHTTTGRKPYCYDHLDRLPYVREVMARLARKDEPEFRDEEILALLGIAGALTVPRLALEVGMEDEAVEERLTALAGRGLLTVEPMGGRYGTSKRIVVPARRAM